MLKPSHSKPLIFVAGLLALIMAAFVLGLDDTSARPLHLQQTWPTRTPTSPSIPPTNPPPGGQPTGQPPGGSPTETETPTLGETATAVLIAPTPEGGYLPTAEPCDLSPMVQSLGNVNVREGPGISYALSGFLVYLEVRPIVGRAAYDPWWLIEFADGSQGWVYDQAVTVSGYIGNIEVVEAPPIDGETPTPGAPWQPTPYPSCTPPPSPTLTPSPAPSSTNSASGTSTIEPSVTSIQETNTPTPTTTATMQPTETSTPVPSETATPVTSEVTTTISPTAAEKPDEAAADASGNANTSWLLIVGVGLIAVGIVTYIFRRRAS